MFSLLNIAIPQKAANSPMSEKRQWLFRLY